MTTLYDDPMKGRRQREAVQRTWMGAYAPIRHIDPVMILLAIGISLLGIVFIFSATEPKLLRSGGNPMYYVNRQLVALALGVVAMVVAAAVDYRILRMWAPFLYLLSIGLLVAVNLVGETAGGAARWITIGGFQFQPTEFAKPGLIVALAALFHERRESALGLRALVEACVLAAVPMALTLLQPDLGTAMVFVAITFGVLLLARVRVRYMAALAVIGVMSIIGVLQVDLLADYQRQRLTSFLQPETADMQAELYNLNQAQIAIGSGQVAGQGLFQGTQTRLSYVPENHTDFIFTALAEETGFIGSAVLLGLYGLLLSRALRVAATSRDTFGTLVAGGIVAVFAFQIFINIGMSLGIMPITGLPLPLFSYGGTSLIATFVMVGILENVYMRRYQ
jgi:rod shape determining protein RodA